MNSLEEEVVIDFLNKEGMKIIQRPDHFSFSLDSVLLSEFCTINRKTKRVLDIGTGNGAIPMLLSKRTNSKITGVEIQETSATLAKKNIQLNNLNNQIDIIKADIADWSDYFTRNSFDNILCNPPFFKVESEADLKLQKAKAIARHELTINLDKICEVSFALLKDGGYLTIVHRPERLPEIIAKLIEYRLEPKRIQFCHSDINKEAKILLIEAIKRGAPGMRVLPPLETHRGGDYSPEVLKIFS